MIDGDGIGDDRRLNVLLKSFIKWVSNPETDHVLHERMLAQLAQCEFAQKKSRLVSNMYQKELDNYAELSKSIEVEIEEAKKNIDKTNIELEEAKQVRKNRIEYDVLAKVINEQPDRQETDIKLASLQKELGKLKVNNMIITKICLLYFYVHILQQFFYIFRKNHSTWNRSLRCEGNNSMFSYLLFTLYKEC